MTVVGDRTPRLAGVLWLVGCVASGCGDSEEDKPPLPNAVVLVRVDEPPDLEGVRPDPSELGVEGGVVRYWVDSSSVDGVSVSLFAAGWSFEGFTAVTNPILITYPANEASVSHAQVYTTHLYLENEFGLGWNVVLDVAYSEAQSPGSIAVLAVGEIRGRTGRVLATREDGVFHVRGDADGNGLFGEPNESNISIVGQHIGYVLEGNHRTDFFDGNADGDLDDSEDTAVTMDTATGLLVERRVASAS